jgi:hypothetical protein
VRWPLECCHDGKSTEEQDGKRSCHAGAIEMSMSGLGEWVRGVGEKREEKKACYHFRPLLVFRATSCAQDATPVPSRASQTILSLLKREEEEQNGGGSVVVLKRGTIGFSVQRRGWNRQRLDDVGFRGGRCADGRVAFAGHARPQRIGIGAI